MFTGFREKTLMSMLEEDYKVNFASSITKHTFVVVVKTDTETNAKTEKAKSMNIPVMSITKFKETYL
jgi:NAD-dependent DNA ligase